MPDLTDAEKAALHAAGYTFERGHWHRCRVCHFQVLGWQHGYFSPSRAVYHKHWIKKSPTVQRILRERLAQQ